MYKIYPMGLLSRHYGMYKHFIHDIYKGAQLFIIRSLFFNVNVYFFLFLEDLCQFSQMRTKIPLKESI